MKDKVIDLKNRGYSRKEISEKLNISFSSVRYWLEPKRRNRLRERSKKKVLDYKNLKQQLGGKCIRCGYNKCLSALHFHHVDPSKKSFTICDKRKNRALKSLIKESRKCILICANCHAELTWPDIQKASFPTQENPPNGPI